MSFRCILLVVSLGLVGCQSTPSLDEQYIFVRVDGKRSADHPTIATKFEMDRAMCFGQVQQSAVGAPLIYYQGLSGAITASMIADQRQSAYVDIYKGCMASKGYMMVLKSQAPVIHAQLKANPQPMPSE